MDHHQEEAFQAIENAMFNGDATEHDYFRKRLAYFLKRWQQKLDDTSRDRKKIEDLAEKFMNGELQI